jgi:hypothetical protein
LKIYSSIITILLAATVVFAVYTFSTFKAESQKEFDAKQTQIAWLSQQLNDSQKANADNAAKLSDLQAKLATVETKEQAQAQQQSADAQQAANKVPVQIAEPLNDMISSVNTGINLEDYSKKLIAIKTAVATYGTSLPQNKADALALIIATYDNALRFWGMKTGNSDIIRLESYRYKEDEAYLTKLGVKPLMPEDINVYHLPKILSALWNMAAQETNTLLHS